MLMKPMVWETIYLWMMRIVRVCCCLLYTSFIAQEGNVKNWLETDEFRQCAEFFRTLYEGGYIPEDVLSSGWSSWNTMLTGDFIWVDQCQLWDTVDVWQERIPGVELDTIYLNEDAPQFRSSSFRNDTAVSLSLIHI